MIAVSDTTPLNYLIQLGHVDLLPALYSRTLVPPAVQRELQHPHAPQAVRNWISSPPDWLEIASPPLPSDPSLSDLDEGEAEAIQLAEHIQADRIILDEALGRDRAQARGLQVIGTLGVLRQASRSGVLDMRQSVEQLRQLGFYISRQVFASVFFVRVRIDSDLYPHSNSVPSPLADLCVRAKMAK